MLFPELVEYFDPDPHSAALNMAIDEVLLRHATVPTLRIYRWSEPAVSCGYFIKTAVATEVAAGRVWVRRWTGGGIVEHGDDLTYTLVIPRSHIFCRHAAAESYRLVHERIARLLAEEGMPARLLPTEPPPVSGACFVSPVRYDLLVAGKKIAGAAQRRTRWGLLHQGSIQKPAPVGALRAKLAPALGVTISSAHLPAEMVAAASTLAAAKYGTAEWLAKF